jgi:hypothetical protein
MHKSVAFLLVVSVSLYSTPLRADSYDNDPEMYADVSYADMNIENADTSCPVSPEPEGQQRQPASSSPSQEEYTDEISPPQNEDTYADQGNYTDHETMVKSESSQQSTKGHYKYWKNILLAVAVIAVAVTALLIVHSNEGHKSHH